MANRCCIRFFVVIIIIAGLTTGICIGESFKGPENITLKGGKSGDVPFPHLQHQEALNDCTVCHNLFPQQIGGINALKSRGELKKKQIMNTHCIKCHKKMKKTGKKTGPTSCRTCHVKK